MRRNARTKHRCIWCEEWIKRHTEYENDRGFGSEGPYSSHFHVECFAAYESLGREDQHRWNEEQWTCKRGEAEQA